MYLATESPVFFQSLYKDTRPKIPACFLCLYPLAAPQQSTSNIQGFKEINTRSNLQRVSKFLKDCLQKNIKPYNLLNLVFHVMFFSLQNSGLKIVSGKHLSEEAEQLSTQKHYSNMLLNIPVNKVNWYQNIERIKLHILPERAKKLFTLFAFFQVEIFSNTTQ